MKKYLFLVLIGLTSFLSSNAFANEENASSGYNTPTVSEKFVFSAIYESGAVKMQWTPFVKGDEEVFKYFKIVSSRTNSNPVYPEDGYLTYSSDMAFSSYTDESPKPGTTWYRICAIYEKSRVCSPVVKVLISE